MPRPRRWEPSDYDYNGGGTNRNGSGNLIRGVAALLGADPSRVEMSEGTNGSPQFAVRNRYWDNLLNQGRGSLLAQSNNAAVQQALFDQKLAQELERLRTDEAIRQKQGMMPLEQQMATFQTNERIRGEGLMSPILKQRLADESAMRVDEYGRMTPLVTARESGLADVEVGKQAKLQPLRVAESQGLYGDAPIDKSGLNLARQERLMAGDRLAGYNDTKSLETSRMTTKDDLELASQIAGNNIAKAREEAKSIPLLGQAERTRAEMAPELINAEISRKYLMPVSSGGVMDIRNNQITGGKVAGGLSAKLQEAVNAAKGISNTNNVPDNPKIATPPALDSERVMVQDEAGKKYTIPREQLGALLATKKYFLANQ